MEKENKILFIAATHGDEGFSLGVLRNIKKRYQKDQFGYDTTVGNPRALKRNIRFVEADLNNSAPGNPNSNVYEERRAAQLIELSNKYKFLIDIHGAVSDSGIVTIISYPTLTNLVLAASLPIKRNVIWYMNRTPGMGSLVRFAKCPGIAIECGPKSSEKIKTELEEVLTKILQTQTSYTISKLLDNVGGKDFYNVYAEQPTDRRNYTDFTLVKDSDEEFYPFLANQYPGIACYKMKKIKLEEIFLFQSKI